MHFNHLEGLNKGILYPLIFLFFAWKFLELLFWKNVRSIFGTLLGHPRGELLFPTYSLQMILFSLLKLIERIAWQLEKSWIPFAPYPVKMSAMKNLGSSSPLIFLVKKERYIATS